MIIIKLMGGLGNQMFQYAAAKRVSKVNDIILKLDLSWFQDKGPWTPRNYELGVFALSSEIADPHEIGALKSRRQNPLFRRLPGFVNKFLFNANQSHIIEKSHSFEPAVLNLIDDVYLDGYWQSEKYFYDIASVIRKDFSLRAEPDGMNRDVASLIQGCNAVSLHFRRGDYVADARTANYHGICSMDYYRKAVKLVSARVIKPHFFIFSDDAAWVQENFKIEFPVTLVQHNGPDRAHVDMWLMSLCHHHIIANSSFSWWGAWLNPNPQKIVIAPSKWFKDPSVNTQDLIPSEWIRC